MKNNELAGRFDAAADADRENRKAGWVYYLRAEDDQSFETFNLEDEGGVFVCTEDEPVFMDEISEQEAAVAALLYSNSWKNPAGTIVRRPVWGEGPAPFN